MKTNRSQIISSAHACAVFIAVELLLLVSTERPARAYVDPGSGAMVWQGLLAVLVGSTFYCRRMVRWVKAWFVRAREGSE
jgi:hypothetical protein